MRKTLLIAFVLIGNSVLLKAFQARKDNSYSLAKFGHTAAWVLPIATQQKAEGPSEYVLLARGHNQGSYGAFGGPCDQKKDRGAGNPVRTAARHFAEQAYTTATLGKNTADLVAHLNPTKENTRAILAIDDSSLSSKNVIYLTHFPPRDLKHLISSFPAARRRSVKKPKHAKDSLAKVTIEQLRKALLGSNQNSRVTVTAEVIDNQGVSSQKQITLRSLFVRMIRSYFEGKPPAQTQKPKTHFYRLR